MSFSAVARHSPGPPPDPGRAELTGLLRALRCNTDALRRLSAARPFDLRRVRELRAQCSDLAKAASALHSAPPREPLAGALSAFGDALRESVAAEAAAADAGVAAAAAVVREEREREAPAESTPLLQGGVVLQVEAREEAVLREIRANEELRREREVALRDVHASVEDVNAIFVDLAKMVGEQAQQVEYVELQLGDAADSVRNAKRELERAQQRREGRRKLFFRTLAVIALIFAVFLLIILR